MRKKRNIWSFPINIAFEMTSLYSKKFDETKCDQIISFDLSKTKNIHSSFIGFLIDAKQKTEKKGGILELTISPELEKILTKKELSDYLLLKRTSKTA